MNARYVASKKIPPETVQEMMRRSLYHIKWYFSKDRPEHQQGQGGEPKERREVRQMVYAEKEKQYPASFKVDFVGKPYEGACYYLITHCPICAYAERLGISELMPRTMSW